MIHALTFAAYAVTLDGKTVLPHARAAVAAGHVLLPVRALGNALGADVGYDGNAHTITVQRGARVATISSRGAVRIVNGKAYAPLRAVATAFGLGVAYEARTRTVALDDRSDAASVARMTPPSATMLPAAPEPARPGTFTITETPRNGAQVHEPYPAISTRFAGATAIDPRSLRVLLDGRDVTRDASVVGDQVLFTPRTALAPGTHDVVVSGRDATTGYPLANAWSFGNSFAFVTAPAPTPFPIAAIWVDRWIVPGTNAFDVYVEGAPGMTGYVGVDGVGGFFPLSVDGANSYVAHVFVPNGVNQPFARVAARITLPNGQQQFIVLPQRFNLVTPPLSAPVPAAPPTADPVPRPVPSRRSVDVPTPTPTPARRSVLTATPAPTATPRPTATPSSTPRPTPTPRTVPTPAQKPVVVPVIVRTLAPKATAPPTASVMEPTPLPTATPQPTRRPLIRRTPAPKPSPTPA